MNIRWFLMACFFFLTAAFFVLEAEGVVEGVVLSRAAPEALRTHHYWLAVGSAAFGFGALAVAIDKEGGGR